MQCNSCNVIRNYLILHRLELKLNRLIVLSFETDSSISLIISQSLRLIQIYLVGVTDSLHTLLLKTILTSYDT
jgi:hypothetical protein